MHSETGMGLRAGFKSQICYFCLMNYPRLRDKNNHLVQMLLDLVNIHKFPTLWQLIINKWLLVIFFNTKRRSS